MIHKAGKRIGKRVKALRKERGLTQKQLAQMSGVKRLDISRLEAGTHIPGIPFIERLAESLQVNIFEERYGTSEKTPA